MVGAREGHRSADKGAENMSQALVRYDFRGTSTVSRDDSAPSDKVRVRVLLERDEEGWVVASSPDFPGAFSQGRTREEALTKMVDAVSLVMEETTGNNDVQLVLIPQN
jgi:predicted RNase H-like HicB family nuclease